MGVIKFLITVVLLGMIMIWIIMPTQTYKEKWRPRLRAKANQSAYFGSQGAPLLVYMFPMLLVASLGCVYIHLKKQKNVSTSERDISKKGCLGAMKRPVLVRGPLGIVSGVELVFLTMFMALLVWSFCMYLRSGFASTTRESAAKKGQKVWQAKLGAAALSLGLVGNIGIAFLFFPVARATSVLPLLGLTSVSSIKYHIWLGHIVMTLFTAHGLSYIILWASTHHLSAMLHWANTDVSVVAGEITLVVGLVMWATTFPRIRRKMFELFFYTHYLYIIFILFFVLHVGISYSLMAFPGFYLFMIDRYVRFLQSRDKVRLASARVLPCNAVEVNFSKTPGFTYSPTSIMFVNIPGISKLQWHPFTVTSSSSLEPEKMSVMIKSEGIWTTKLYRLLSSHSPPDRLEVSVEGPYGPASTDFLRYDSLVMVSGGSGITPFISIIRDLISAKHKSQTPKITLICAFKNSSDLSMLDLILPMNGASPDISTNLNLQIEAFVTREKAPSSTNESKNIRSLWFKSHVTDAPISPVLGPNGWLWLGAVISSSFVIFMVLIGIITRFYIYPIDRNSNEVYSYSSRAALNLLVICISIAATASAAVLWNKKRYAVEAKQVQNVEQLTSPQASRSSWFYTSERELESFPHQFLVQSTRIHYGKRPDLKKILFEAQGSSVRVLASGPKKLRHEVAMICSSGQVDNLHFESISFSW